MPADGRIAALAAALLLLGLPFRAGAVLPDEGDCPTVRAAPTAESGSEDVAPLVIREGMVLDQDDLLVLRQLVPAEIWQHREVFFFEGMQMVIGPCHRRYPVPDFYAEATKRFAGQPRVDDEGNLRGYTAGLPFPPESIDPDAPDAAVRWAWNLATRYRGAGHKARFRLEDQSGRIGAALTFEGEFFLVLTRHRADLAETGYELPDADDHLFSAGGRFTKPFDARHLAWRQLRPEKALDRFTEPDDTFVYVPTMRKSRRAATTWVDGLYFPRYMASGDTGGGGIPIGDPTSGAGGSINPTAGLSIAASENLRRGFTGLALRPNAYVWRIRDEREVLAPLNGYRQGWPEDPNRNFGESGLSVASDRWEVRWAVVLMGQLLQPGGDFQKVLIYVDYQTQQPLYWITRTGRRRLVDVGILVHRWSGDVAGYPAWPGGGRAYVFDPVAEVFYDAASGAGGWRRESYDMRSVPFDKGELRTLLSASAIDRSH
jgi:hypothetical protein